MPANWSRKSGELHPEKARKTRQAYAAVRGTINVPYLLSWVQGVVMGQIQCSPTQMRAAECLLRKVLPDMQTIEHSGGDLPVIQRIERVIVQPKGVQLLTKVINEAVIEQDKQENLH